MSTPVFVDPESSTQADEAQSSRVPVPLLEDPYEAIRQAYLDGTDTESEPFEDPTDTKTLESPIAIAPPVLVPILNRIARMVVRVPHAMSSGLSATMAEVVAMSESALLEGSEEDNDGEDEEIEESMDSDSVSKDAEEEGSTAEDEDPAAEDEGLTARVEGPGMDDEDYDLDDGTHGRDDEGRGIDDEGHSVESDGLGLEEEEAVPGDQWQTAPVVGTTGSGLALESERPKRSAFRQPTLTTWTNPEDSMIYIDIPDYPPPASHVQTPPSPEWTSGLLPISLSHSDVPSPISPPMIPLIVPSPVATPATELSPALFERYDKDIRELFTRSRAVREEIFSQRYRFRSLEYEQERVAVTFRAIWRPVLALEAWAGQTDAQRAALWHAVSDVQGENQDLQLQLAEERRALLELVKVFDGMRRGQEPRGST
ncbi:hypothetical protein Tco_0853764 [Tanacetum coccineum]